MKSIIITGANGFIGSHLTTYIAAQHYKVYAVVMPDTPISKRMIGIKNVEILEGKLSCYKQIAEKISGDICALIHLAWDGVSTESRVSCQLQLRNIELALNAVRLAHTAHAERFIFPGSTLEYSYCGRIINEMAIPSPQNAYGAAKISARYMCESLCRELNVAYIYTVITGIYGGGRNDNNVISYCIRELLLGNKPKLTGLEQLWDYIHINDLVRAMFLVAIKGKPGAFYSIGHGDNWPLSNYIKIIHKCIDPKLPIGIGEVPYPDDRLPASCIDLTAIKRDTGFAPRISFEQGIKPVIEEMRLELNTTVKS